MSIDDVVVAYTLTGTQRGKFLGVAPTGRQATARGVEPARFLDADRRAQAQFGRGWTSSSESTR